MKSVDKINSNLNKYTKSNTSLMLSKPNTIKDTNIKLD